MRRVTENKTVSDLKKGRFLSVDFHERGLALRHQTSSVCVRVNEFGRDGFTSTMDHSALKKHTIP